jgi:transcriptional regulator with XRE-family HTH domain
MLLFDLTWVSCLIYKDLMSTSSEKSSVSSNKATDLLLKKFKESQLRNPNWSQRAFAQKLGLSSGSLSEIMKGKRPLTARLKKKIAGILQLSPVEQLDFFEEDLPQNMRPARHEYFRLSEDQFHLISDWWHYAILNLVKTKGFTPDQNWIAERLGLSTKVVAEAWDRLFRLGFLKRTQGKVTREYPRIETSDDLFDLSIRKAHIEDTKLIEKSLLDVAVDLRDHTSMTLVMNKKNIKKAKEIIRLFQDQFSEEVETKGGQGEEVYRLSISLFPLTKMKEHV